MRLLSPCVEKGGLSQHSIHISLYCIEFFLSIQGRVVASAELLLLGNKVGADGLNHADIREFSRL